MSLEVDITLDGADLPAVLSLDRQLEFAAATAATDVARSSVDAAIDAIQEEFDTTNDWYLTSNRMGIHYTPATRDNPTASVHTPAYWLKPHETGADKTPRDGEFLAIPTEAIKEPGEPLSVAHRPQNLKDAFVIRTKRGPKLFRRINNPLQLVYNFARRARIQKRSTVIEPTVKTTQDEFPKKFIERLKEALRTAK